MTYFLKSGNCFRVSSAAAMDLHDTLPPGNYIIKIDQHGQFFLEGIEDFQRPSKLYGDTLKHTDRILRTFASRPGCTGVMLAGEKGSGKSLLAKNLGIEGAKLDIPTIVINAPFKGDSFNKFLQDIEQPCIVLFDEFEKVYDRDDQESILTLLDGVFPSKKLFILTCNDKWRVDSHMRNRPGRIYYMLDFTGLSIEFVREYCEDNLKNKSHIDKICQITGLFAQFNFDMLKAIIEEMNRYNESPQEVLKLLNVKPEYDENQNRYNVRLIVNGVEFADKHLGSDSMFRGNPLLKEFSIDYDPDPEDDDSCWEAVRFAQADLHRIDPNTGRFEFKNKSGHVILTKVAEKTFNYYDAF